MSFFLVVVILLLGFVFRLAISHLGFNDDVITNAGWGQWIFEHGTRGFYENNVWTYSWPTQPPLISLIYGFNYWLYVQILWFFSYVSAVIVKHHIFVDSFWWFINFVRWFDKALYAETPFKYGFLISMKLIAIISDVLITVLVYCFSFRKVGSKKALLFSASFLFLPFSWYTSALWGQYDQLAVLLLVISFILLYKRLFFVSVLLLVLSFETKPTGLMLLPIYIVYYVWQKPKIISIMVSALFAFGTVFLLSYPFADRNVFSYTYQVVYPKVFFAGRSGALATHTFNFWQLIAPYGGWVDWRYIFIPAKYWSMFLIGVIYTIGLYLLKKRRDLGGLFFSLYVISAGVYLFSTGMLDRYFYAAAVFLLFASIYHKGLSKWWVVTGALFSLNLFYSWGFPIFDKYSAWNNSSLIQLGSLLQIIVFIFCLKKILNKEREATA